MSGGGAEAGSKGVQAVVGTGRLDVEGMRTVDWEVEQTEGEEDTERKYI